MSFNEEDEKSLDCSTCSVGDEMQAYKILEAVEVVDLMEKEIAQVSDIVSNVSRSGFDKLLIWIIFLIKYCFSSASQTSDSNVIDAMQMGHWRLSGKVLR